MKRLLVGVLLLGGCSKEPLGGACTSDYGCDSRAEKCLRVNGKDEPGVCSRRCASPQDCAPTAMCGRIQMKKVGGIMGKLSAGGGTEAWCLPQ